MRMRSATLALLLLASSCGGISGYLSRDLENASIRLHSERPAELAGTLDGPMDPEDFLSEASISGVSCLGMTVARDDSAGIAEAVTSNPLLFAGRLDLTVGAADRPIELAAEQKGLIWTPDVIFTMQGDSFQLEAGVTIRNETGQTWSFDRLEIADSSDSLLMSATEPGSILPGDVTYPWRTLTGRILGPVVSYGFPEPADWSVIRPVATCSADLRGLDASSAGLAGWTGDTLWLDGGGLLELSVTRNPLPSGYGFDLIVRNPGERPVEFGLMCPPRLPSGAAVIFESTPPDAIELPPGGEVSIRYRISYTRS
jgi:hypothetical protein